MICGQKGDPKWTRSTNTRLLIFGHTHLKRINAGYGRENSLKMAIRALIFAVKVLKAIDLPINSQKEKFLLECAFVIVATPLLVSIRTIYGLEAQKTIHVI